MTIYTVYDIDKDNNHNSMRFMMFSTQKKTANQFFMDNMEEYKEYGGMFTLVLAYYDSSGEPNTNTNALLEFYPIITSEETPHH